MQSKRLRAFSICLKNIVWIVNVYTSVTSNTQKIVKRVVLSAQKVIIVCININIIALFSVGPEHPCVKEEGVQIRCPECKRFFFSNACFEHHKGETCNMLKRCELCQRIYYKDNKQPHKCFTSYCRRCKVKQRIFLLFYTILISGKSRQKCWMLYQKSDNTKRESALQNDLLGY